MGRPPKKVPHPKKIAFDMSGDPSALLKAVDRLSHLDEAGDHAKLLEAAEIVLCRILPGSYLAENFARRFRAWELWQVPDLAAAFKVKRSNDPRTIKAKRKQMKVRWEILSFLTNAKRRGTGHKAAVKQAAKTFGITVSVVDDIYRGNPDLRTIIEHTPTWMFGERS